MYSGVGKSLLATSHPSRLWWKLYSAGRQMPWVFFVVEILLTTIIERPPIQTSEKSIPKCVVWLDGIGCGISTTSDLYFLLFFLLQTLSMMWQTKSGMTLRQKLDDTTKQRNGERPLRVWITDTCWDFINTLQSSIIIHFQKQCELF